MSNSKEEYKNNKKKIYFSDFFIIHCYFNIYDVKLK